MLNNNKLSSNDELINFKPKNLINQFNENDEEQKSNKKGKKDKK
jgi:hypothetical protein